MRWLFIVLLVSLCYGEDSLVYSFWAGNYYRFYRDTTTTTWDFGAEFEFKADYYDLSILPNIVLHSSNDTEIEDVNLEVVVSKGWFAYNLLVKNSWNGSSHFLGVRKKYEGEELGAIFRTGIESASWIDDYRVKMYFQSYFKRFSKEGAPPYFEVGYSFLPIKVGGEGSEILLGIGFWGNDLFKRVPIIGDMIDD